MATQSSVSESAQIQGPSGFIELNGNMLVVDYGKVFGPDRQSVGFLYEDGFLKNCAGPLGNVEHMRPIEEVSGMVFRGIDSRGLELELPSGDMGPSGSLNYNNVALQVVHGRIATQDHRLVGYLDDDGVIYARDHVQRLQRVKMEENTQLTTVFSGIHANGKGWNHEFVRKLPAYRRDKTYSVNEIIRYFTDYDRVTTQQKKYVLDSMQLWASIGLLQIVRKSEGDAALGNVKHGAAGVTAVRTGMVHLDKDEFEKEVGYFKQWGTFAIVQTMPQFLEVRINLVVAHEFGHQLEFCLSQKSQERINDLYEQRKSHCNKVHPLPNGYGGASEMVQKDRVFSRVFISGYARSSMHEYWAEAVAAFSTLEGRKVLKQLDPAVYQILHELVHKPEEILRSVYHDTIRELQASLRLGGEFTENVLDS
ncbi:MAG: hypothetical protein ACRD3W_09055 [Terriglobales bacterium]